MNTSFSRRLALLACLVLLGACSTEQRPLTPFSTSTSTPLTVPITSPTRTQLAPVQRATQPNAAALSLWGNKDASVAIDRIGKGAVYDMALSPDGKTIAVMGLVSVTAYDLNSLETIWTSLMEHPSVTTDRGQILWSPDGTQLATLSDAGITLWDARTGKPLQSYKGDPYVYISSVIWRPDGKVAAVDPSPGHLALWELETGEPLFDFKVDRSASPFKWLPYKNILVTSTGDGNILVWNTQSKKQISPLLKVCDGYCIEGLGLSPDGRRLVSLSIDETNKGDKFIVWDVKTGAQLFTKTPSQYNSTVYAREWSPDSRYLAVAFQNGIVVIWDIQTGEQLPSLNVTKVQDLAWSANGDSLIVLSRYKSLSVWDVKTGKPRRSLDEHTSWWMELAWSPDGSLLAWGAEDGEIVVWDPSSGKKIRSFYDPKGWVTNLTWSPDGKRLATGGQGAITIWDVEAGKQLGTWVLNTQALFGLAWSPDGSILASASYDGTINFWDPSTETHLRTLEEKHWSTGNLVWSPQGDLLAGDYPEADTSKDQLIFWDPQTGQPVRLQSGLHNLTWSPLGDRAAAISDSGTAYGGDDTTLVLWDPRTGKELRRFNTGILLNHIAWSPDGELLVIGPDEESALLVLDPETGEVIHRLQGHYDTVTRIAWSPRGDLIASCSWDGTVILWRVNSP